MAPLSDRQFLGTQQIDTVRRVVADARACDLSVACVPTMGALHAGHLSLIEAARKQCGFVVVTIFVNPTQFGPREDFQAYPRPLSADLSACRAEQVDVVFYPSAETIYPVGDSTIVDVEGLSSVLEGRLRPGHLRGVATVVLKLLNIVFPDVAYFGQKDFQQQLLIHRLCRELHLPVDIRTCPTVRDVDGLALSSRNAYLSPDERVAALAIPRSLTLAYDLLKSGESIAVVTAAMMDHLTADSRLHVDYATLADPETLDELVVPQPQMVALAAARIGQTRLIDNRLIQL